MLEDLVKLNSEYTTASESRRKEIIEQIIMLVPKIDDSITSSTQKLVNDLKQDLESMQSEIHKIDMQQYIRRASEIQSKIVEHANMLGVQLEAADLKSFQQLLDGIQK